MAKSIQEIFNTILAEKQKRPELNELNSASSSAIHRLWIYITAVAHNVLYVYHDQHKKEVDVRIAANQPGTPTWYAERTKEFQVGDQLDLVNNVFQYRTVDPLKRIITQVSYKEDNGTLFLKVAKGLLTPEALSATELTQLRKYMERRKYAGTNVNIVSLNPDKLRVTGTVFFDGIFAPQAIQTRVEAALLAYMKSLPFDGLVYRNRVVDIIQQMEGVVDVEVTGLDIVQGAVVTPVVRVAETASGYLVEDETTGFTFAETLTYTAN